MNLLKVSMIIKSVWTLLRKRTSSVNQKNEYPSDIEMERTEQIIDLFNFKNGRELTQLYLKSDDFLLACVLRKS